MWKEKLINLFKNNLGIIVGGVIGLLVYILGITKMLTMLFMIFLGMVIGNSIEKNKVDVKESIKSFIDKI